MTKLDPMAFLNDALSRLRDAGASLPWAERRDIAAMLARGLATSGPTQSAIDLAFLLAGDDKPEVRKEIAEAMVHLPDEPFTKLAAKLSEDVNAFVKKAAERSIARRRRSAKQVQQTRRKLGSVDSRMAAFEELYGQAAMKEARRIADYQYSALVQQTHHNIPNILSPVKTSITTLLKQFEKGNPDTRFCIENLERMARRLEDMERFLNDMKEYAKAKAASERQRERVLKLVYEARDMALSALRRAKTPTTQISLAIDVPESLTVCVAQHQVVMAMVHILRNAYESFHMGSVRKKGRRIEIAAHAVDGGMVEVMIGDNGPGVHPDDLEMLQEFVPIEKSRKPNGTGFGIATAAGYVEAQGGTLSINSVQGEGFTVTMILPTECEDDE